MNETTYCTQFSDQECSEDNCCLDREIKIKDKDISLSLKEKTDFYNKINEGK